MLDVALRRSRFAMPSSAQTARAMLIQLNQYAKPINGLACSRRLISVLPLLGGILSQLPQRYIQFSEIPLSPITLTYEYKIISNLKSTFYISI
jgi:hypothetical protein